MAAVTTAEEQSEVAEKALQLQYSQSASTFPQSFPLLESNSSNASSILTDYLESGNVFSAEQQETLAAVLEADEPQSGAATPPTQSSTPDRPKELAAREEEATPTENGNEVEGSTTPPTQHADQASSLIVVPLYCHLFCNLPF